MPRKIILDGNVNDRPSLPFAIFLCLIPITTFFYMKRRQRNRNNQVPASTGQPAAPGGSRTGEPAGDTETQKKEKDKKEKDKKDKDKQKWEEMVAAEKENTEKAKQKAAKAENEAATLKRQLKEAEQKIKEGRYKLDLAKHPNDPFLDDQNPDEVFDTVKPINRNPTSPSKSAMRNGPLFGQDPGNPLHSRKSADFKKSNDQYKHPVDGIATKRKNGGPGIARHDISRHVPRDQNEDAWNTYAADDLKAKGRHLTNDRYKGPAHLQNKTDELKKHLPETTFAIFQKAANIACARKGSAEYEEAMIDNSHEEHGVYPFFASAPIEAVAGLFTEDDVKTVLQGMLSMIKKIKRGSKDPNDFMRRHCVNRVLDKKTMAFLWYLDSFRVVSSLVRMNIVRGEPLHLDKTLGLKFILLEWLEIFGIECAQQRLLSRAGFDLAGLCMRLYCLPVDKSPDELKLRVTIFLPGGPNRVNEKGVEMENWAMRMNLAVSSWREVWGFLSLQTGAEDRNWGHEAFAERELVFSPGFTLEGIKQAGGLPTEASPNSEPNNRHDPILNAFTPPKHPYPGSMLTQFGHRIIPRIRPTSISFERRRQYTWAHTSLTKTSHDFVDGMVDLCLEMIDPQDWVLGAAQQYPHEVTDDNLLERLRTDDVKTIKFNSTIPMTMGKNNKPVGFPDITIHPKLDEIYMAYVGMTRHTDGTPSAKATMPATATLVLAHELGLWPLLHRNDVPDKAKKVTLYVDIKNGDVQQFADELLETLVGLGKKRLGAGWSGDQEAIDRDAKEDRDVLRQVHCQLENNSTFPISQRISNINW